MIGLPQACNSSKIYGSSACFLIKGKMMEDLQDVGKTPDERHRFTIHRIISIIEDRWAINNLVGNGSNTVLFNLRIRLDKTSQESGRNVSKTAVHAGITMSISTNEYTGKHASKRGNNILIVFIYL